MSFVGSKPCLYSVTFVMFCNFFHFEDPCPAQFSYVPGAFNCYLTSERQAYTWQQADAECKSRDGGLVALETREEFDETKEWFLRSEYFHTKYIAIS